MRLRLSPAKRSRRTASSESGTRTLTQSYDPTIYLGAAEHYRSGRPAYSPRLEAVLTEELGLDGTGRLLDGGCGPGILTVRLARLFDARTC